MWAQSQAQLKVEPGTGFSQYSGRKVLAIEVHVEGSLWLDVPQLRAVEAGDIFSPELGRRLLREATDEGGFASAELKVLERGSGLVLELFLWPRRIVEQIIVQGDAGYVNQVRRIFNLLRGHGASEADLLKTERSLLDFYRTKGFPAAAVSMKPEETDRRNHVLLRVKIERNEPERIESFKLYIHPSPPIEELEVLLRSTSLKKGGLADEAELTAKAQNLTTRLQNAGFYRAKVDWQRIAPGRFALNVQSGPLYSLVFEGQSIFPEGQIRQQLNLDKQVPKPELLEPLLVNFFIQEGFLDAQVNFIEAQDARGTRAELRAQIRLGDRVTVGRRRYPCLADAYQLKKLNQEVDGVLAEQFPTETLLKPVEPQAVDEAIGHPSPTPRPTPLPRAPWTTYSNEAYEAVSQHLADVLRAEGYLSVNAGPALLYRRRCRPGTAPNICLPEGPVVPPDLDCTLPLDEEWFKAESCEADLRRGVRCESTGTLLLPIQPGPQTRLYDVEIEGNATFTEEQVFTATGLKIGESFSPNAVDKGLKAVREIYLNEGYAFAQVDSDLVLSEDGSRAQLLISINERRRVEIERIDIRGARRTRESVIRRRLALKVGDYYQLGAVQSSQLHLESLGVFTSVSVGLEDPNVAARKKVVVVSVTEKQPQYLDIKGGFATGDGFRIGFEYGHRNLGGAAIQFTLRSQLGLRPPGLIPQEDVREKYEEQFDNYAKLLERRNSLTFGFPDIGLGPRYRFEIELLDLRDNQRDYAQGREAANIRLNYVPVKNVWTQIGASVEYNDAVIFGDEATVANYAGSFRIPEGYSIVFAQALAAAWDRRDNALSATRGTFLRAGVEHVTAIPVGNQGADGSVDCEGDPSVVLQPVCSELLRWQGRAAGYIPLSKKGMTIAVSISGGAIQQLTSDSLTYPDRLFFMGGIDTLRGYPQDSLVPQDIAEQLLSPDSDLTIDDVVLRGGDIYLNPRVELRIPVIGSFHTAVFLDMGNLWFDPNEVNLLEWRYTIGTGIRFQTPVGPLVFDYGLNIERFLDAIAPSRKNQRYWENVGAFHFSIGLF
ncbi:MAG: BamA/TamA family outer membrane protein [Polyangiaceae bacterium]|nr:BamA/TamA family outer membrane protein [Polyangiaceae bacterium]